jgi:hypothetical protein
MSRAVRLVAVIVFALAYFCQPLALDACSLSCEAARAARSAAVAAPCHHSSSCATQITQPTSPGSRVTNVAVVPFAITTAIEPHAVVVTLASSYELPQHFTSPPIPLRI